MTKLAQTAAPVVPGPRRSAVVLSVGAVLAALVVNLGLLAAGHALGGDFVYHQAGRPVTVTGWSVTVMTVGPLATGLVVVVLLAARWPAVARAGLVVGPGLALVTILLLTLPADFDAVSTVTLSLMHLTLVPATVAALLPLTGRHPRRR